MVFCLCSPVYLFVYCFSHNDNVLVAVKVFLLFVCVFVLLSVSLLCLLNEQLSDTEICRIAGYHELADRLIDCQYELTDRLAFYLCGRKPGKADVSTMDTFGVTFCLWLYYCRSQQWRALHHSFCKRRVRYMSPKVLTHTVCHHYCITSL